jgi:predicted GNAT family N-acyltransferase
MTTPDGTAPPTPQRQLEGFGVLIMIVFRLAETRADHGRCIVVRTLVFEVEQGVANEIEIDQHEDACRHILGMDDDNPIAAARWRVYRPGVAKIERVAILKPWRARNLGTALMQATISDIKHAAPELETLRLEAQDSAIAFYEKIGFAVVGDGFLQANIPHHAMERDV